MQKMAEWILFRESEGSERRRAVQVWIDASGEFDKQLVHTAVGRKLRMKGRGHGVSLADQSGMAFAKGEGFDTGTDLDDPGSADEDHFERAAGEGGFGNFDAGVDLTAVGVAFDYGVEETETALGGVADFPGKENGSGAGAEDGLLGAEFAEGLEEVALFKEFEHGGGFAAGEDEGVDGGELFGVADFGGLGAGLGKGEGVGGVVALDGEDADAGMLVAVCSSSFFLALLLLFCPESLDKAPIPLTTQGEKIVA
jgi:hypothetical protein